MQGKKGQGLSTSTIVLIILAVAVLVILILGFTIGWSKIFPFIQSNNIQDIKTACGIACSTGSTYDFCSVQRDINDGATPSFKQNCFNLANNATYANYGIDKCSSITCASA